MRRGGSRPEEWPSPVGCTIWFIKSHQKWGDSYCLFFIFCYTHIIIPILQHYVTMTYCRRNQRKVRQSKSQDLQYPLQTDHNRSWEMNRSKYQWITPRCNLLSQTRWCDVWCDREGGEAMSWTRQGCEQSRRDLLWVICSRRRGHHRQSSDRQSQSHSTEYATYILRIWWISRGDGFGFQFCIRLRGRDPYSYSWGYGCVRDDDTRHWCHWL